MRKDTWSKKEIEILTYNWDIIEPHNLKIWSSLLPNRTYDAIKKKARLLNLKRDLSKFSKKKEFKCIECGTIFNGYGNKILCSRECTAKYMSKNRVGEKNPYFHNDKEITTKCKSCGKEFIWTYSGQHKDNDRIFCSRECASKYYSQENHPNWKGGIQHYPYSNEFNNKLKNEIRERDNNSCRLCGDYNQLCIHHIDYNKENSDKDNLITLCRSCHSKTNFNRNFWENTLTFLTTLHQVVVKTWGFEFIPINDDDYCLKALVFWKGKSFSNHYHKIKKESWYVLEGKMVAKLTYPNGDIEEFIFKKGDVLDIGQGLCHILTAIDNTILIEISTHHEDSDSYRVVTGGKVERFYGNKRIKMGKYIWKKNVII